MAFCSRDIPRKINDERRAPASDLDCLRKDDWLMDTEVRYRIRYFRSQWYVSMVYIALDNPLQFLQRNIAKYSSKTKAETYARIMQRGIRKDARGTLKSDLHAFNICDN